MKKIIGITGTIASGKSTVCQYLEQKHGIMRIDADKVGHQILTRPDVIKAICQAFSDDVLDEHGQIVRKKLGSIVFQDPQALQKLNAITHPAICEAIRQQVQAFLDSDSQQPYMMVEAIELLRSPLKDLVDEVWVVTADDTVRLARLMVRDQLSADQAQDRLNSQMPTEAYVKAADRVIDNSADPQTLHAFLDRLTEEMKI